MINTFWRIHANGEKMAEPSEENAGTINISGYTVIVLQELGCRSLVQFSNVMMKLKM